jgi:tetratricopeptide (TPR) repeat protein
MWTTKGRPVRTWRHRVRDAPSVQVRCLWQRPTQISKSQIALEYAYRFIEKFPRCSIFWVCAANTARFEEAYRRIASEYEIPGREDPKGDLMQLVRDWLENRYRTIWLMVVDNVDDIRTFFKKNAFGKSLSEYIPQSPRGAILYTTRDRGIAANLVPPQGLIGVPRMDSTEARGLLGQKIARESTEEEQSKLVEGLDYLPFAISQAVTLMTEIGLTISQYLAHYGRSYSARIQLLSYKFADYQRKERPMESVATTWMISFNYIQRQNPRAADLIALMSFLDRHGIPKSLLARKDEDPLDFAKAIGTLDAFSLIAADDQHENYKVNPLVQLATRLWLTENDNVAKKAPLALGLALESVARYFPNGEYEHWTTCKAYLPHAEAVLHSACEEYPNTNIYAQATILLNTSCYFRNTGNFELAEARARVSVRLRQEALGTKHPDTLASVSNLASVLHDLGDYKAAEAMNRRALEGRMDSLGKDNPETLISFSNLASTLQDQGRHKEAEDMNREALEGHEKVLGYDHPDTLASLNNLALVLQQRGKLKEAEEMHRRALEGSKKVLGPKHPDTLVSLQNLAEALRDQGRYGEAETMHRRALRGLEKTLGEDHPFTLTSLHNLAEVLRYRGMYDEAEETHRQALEGSERVLGSVHPYTLTSLYNLAELLRYRGKYDAAEEMHRLAMKGREEVLGKTHLDTLASASCLALVLRDRRMRREAKEINHQALRVYEEMLRDNPSTLVVRDNLLQERAEDTNQILGGYTVSGKEHSQTPTSHSNNPELVFHNELR